MEGAGTFHILIYMTPELSGAAHDNTRRSNDVIVKVGTVGDNSGRMIGSGTHYHDETLCSMPRCSCREYIKVQRRSMMPRLCDSVVKFSAYVRHLDGDVL